MAGPKLREKRIVGISKPAVRFNLKRCLHCCSVAVMLAVVFLFVCFEGRFLIDNIHSHSDRHEMIDQIFDTHKPNNSGTASSAVDFTFPANKSKHRTTASTENESSATTGVQLAATSDTQSDGKVKIHGSEDEIGTGFEAGVEQSDSEAGVEQSDSKNVHGKTLAHVFHFPANNDDGIEMRMELDGLVGSKAIRLISDANASMLLPNLVWVGSPVPIRLCNMRWVRLAVEHYRALNPGKTMKEDWTFHLFDWDDKSDRLLRCNRLEILVGKEKVHYWKRSIVFGRHWNATTQSIEIGQVSTELDGAQIRPLHLSTRTDIAEGIASTLMNITNRKMTPKELSEYVVTKARPGDVVHHWPARGRGVNRGAPKKNIRNDLLRTETSLTLEKMTFAPYNLSDVFCGMHGDAKDKGRSSTSNSYIDSILHYKIIVVTQRDIFEGHLRLFEGLVSGAMVLHDRISAPPVGLEENVNIVYFDNQEELKEKVMYYLANADERLRIARAGRRLAMCQSRTWHRMEQVILGQTVTPCYE